MVTDLDGIFTALGAVRGVATDLENYTFALTDAGKIREMNSLSARQYTIPLNATVAFPVNSVIRVVRLGTGTLTLKAAAGVTLNGVDGGTVAADQYGSFIAYKRGTNDWIALAYTPVAAVPAVVLLASGTVSSASNLEIDISSYTAYRKLVLRCFAWLPSSDGADFRLRTSIDGGSGFENGSSDYK